MYSSLIRSTVAVVLIVVHSQVMAYGNSPMNRTSGTGSGVVLETMDSGGYTYMKLEQDGKALWVAAPKTVVAVGDNVQFNEEMRMRNFTSNTLNRTFDELVFISRVGSSSAAPASAPKQSSPGIDAGSLEPVAKAEGGYTVAEVFSNKDALKGKVIKVRGKVVKVSQAIMGMNWIHLMDGSGSDGSNKVIFRSPQNLAKVGSIVTAEGTLITDLDLGYGYRYEVLVDDSTFTE